MVATRLFSAGIAGSLVALALGASPALAGKDDTPAMLAADEDARKLQPISPWNLDYAENRCRMARLFGSGEDRHALILEQASPGSRFGVTFAGSELRRFRNATELNIGLQDDMPLRSKDNVGRGEFPGLGDAIIIASVGLSSDEERTLPYNAGFDLEEASKVERIMLQHRGRILSFETGNMRAAFEAMNTCTMNLLEYWGLDAEAHQSYVPPVWTNQEVIVRRLVSRYPSTALRRGEQGIFRMRVIIEEDGTVSDCLIENSTEVTTLESPACELMMEAEFDPALDTSGQPMRSFYSTAITYSIGG